MAAFIKTNSSIILQGVGRTMRLDVGSPAAEKAIELIKAGADDDTIWSLVDPIRSIRKHSSGLFNVSDDGSIFVGSDPLPPSLAKRVLEFHDIGIIDQVKALVNFWNNLKQNPSKDAQQDLYAFMEHNSIPVTPDGCFIGYKSVKKNRAGDFWDCHTFNHSTDVGTFRNNIGDTPSMKREDVNGDRNQTCSNGLHIAAFNYAKDFTGDALIECKVNPKDVVSVPADYNGEKMRVCTYTVVAVNAYEKASAAPISKPLYDDGSDIGDEGDDEWNDDSEGDGSDWNDETYEGSLWRDEVKAAPARTGGGANDSWKTQARDRHGRFLPKV